MKRRWSRVALVLAVLLSGRVYAQPAGDGVHEREVKAREFFVVGRFAEALEIYGRLYAESGHPTYIRNIARCHQKMGEPEKAISSFRDYLRQATDITAEQRALVESYIAEMELMKERREAAARAASPAAPVPPPPAAAAP